MTTFPLRAANAADCLLLAHLHGGCFPRPWSPLEFASFYEQDHVLSWIGHSQTGAAAGFIFGWLVAGHCELLAVGVLPEWRGRGLARLLLRTLLDGVRQAGAEQVFLEVSVANQAARALYTSEGFAVIGRRKDYYHLPDGTSEDAITMSYRLNG